MAELVITIEDVGNENEVEVKAKCVGDKSGTKKPTPAQILANKCMEFIAKELEA